MGDEVNQETTTHTIWYYWSSFVSPITPFYRWLSEFRENLIKHIWFSAQTQTLVLWFNIPCILLPVTQAPPRKSPHYIHKPWPTVPISPLAAVSEFFSRECSRQLLSTATGSWQAKWNRFATSAAAIAVSLNGLGWTLIFVLYTLRIQGPDDKWERCLDSGQEAKDGPLTEAR